MRNIGLIAIVILVVSGSSTPVRADTIDVFSQYYEISGATGQKSVHQSSAGPVVAAINDATGSVFLLAEGAAGSSSGFVGTRANVHMCCGGWASAVLDLRTTTPDSINLTTSGSILGQVENWIRFVDLTDDVVLLDHHGVWNGSFWDFGGFFTFSLDPSKDYRLQTFTGLSGPDGGWARVDFSAASIPEAATIWLLLPSLVVLGIVRRKLLQHPAERNPLRAQKW